MKMHTYAQAHAKLKGAAQPRVRLQPSTPAVVDNKAPDSAASARRFATNLRTLKTAPRVAGK